MPDRPRHGSLLVIFLTVFIDLLGFGIVLPLLPIYGKQFALLHGLSDAQVGWVTGLLMSSFSVMQLLFLPIWGRLSDHFGRRPILMIGLAGSMCFYALFGVATMFQSLGLLFVARIGAGIAGATISTAQAYIADSTAPEQRAKGMALIGAAFALGFTVGPLLGAVSLLVGQRAELSPWPGFAAALLSAAALALAVFKLPESHTPGSGERRYRLFDATAFRSALSTPSVALLIASSFVAVFSFANFEATLSLQIDRIVRQSLDGSAADAPLAGWRDRLRAMGYETEGDVALITVFAAFAYLGLILTLAQGILVRRLAGRLSEGTMASAGAVLAIVAFFELARAARGESLGVLLWAMAMEVVGFALVNPSLQSLISRRSDPALQGGILGLGQSAASLARILGPVFGLRLFAASPAAPYLAAAVLMIFGLVLIVVAARRGRDFGHAV